MNDNAGKPEGLTKTGPVGYKRRVIDILQTETFVRWLAALRDTLVRKRIAQRIARVQNGLVGDSKSVGDGVFELRIDHGPGYRLYYARRGSLIFILLCGGDKQTQQRDIARAKTIWAELEQEGDG